MLRRYPVGIQDFSVIREGGYAYVDKTTFIDQLFVHGKFYFLSRPRRFGKSLFLSTLEYLFQGRKDLFEGLYIYERWSWDKTNPIIKISFSNIGHSTLGLEKAINLSLETNATKYGIELSQTAIDQKFKELIEKLDTKHGKVVILIDEYDKPIIDYIDTDIPKAIENRGILKSFYSILKDADPHLKLVFITGVSKFSKVSIFSDLNNLNDITLDADYSGICGITQTELEHNFEEELKVYDAEKIKHWYNGYSWKGTETVYNPFSLVNFFVKNGDFQNYWFFSGTPTFLMNLAKREQLYDFEQVETDGFQLDTYDLERLSLVPLMFQTGYLTIKSYDNESGTYELGYPNEEVRKSYLTFLANAYSDNTASVRVLAGQMQRALSVQDFAKVQSIFNTIFKSIPYEVWQRENEHYYHALIHLTFRLLDIYVQSQVQTADGRADAIVILEKYVYAFEFKLDGKAEVALQQIKDKRNAARGYFQPYLHQNKICIGIGLNFSKELKKVEKIVWEQLTNEG